MAHALNYTGFCTIAAGLFLALSGCKDMSRFKQETFSCGLNKAGIFEVVVRSNKSGDDAIVTTKNGETRMPITQSSASLITIADEQMKIVIDRHTKSLNVTMDKTMYHLECKSSIFKM